MNEFPEMVAFTDSVVKKLFIVICSVEETFNVLFSTNTGVDNVVKDLASKKEKVLSTTFFSTVFLLLLVKKKKNTEKAYKPLKNENDTITGKEIPRGFWQITDKV